MVEETIIHDSELLENNQPEEKSERLCKLPISRVRTIIKADQDVSIASQESVFLISKATVSVLCIIYGINDLKWTYKYSANYSF